MNLEEKQVSLLLERINLLQERIALLEQLVRTQERYIEHYRSIVEKLVGPSEGRNEEID